MSSKNSRGDENRCRKTVSHSLQACLTIYNSIHAMHSEYSPRAQFLKVCAGSENNTERFKALPLKSGSGLFTRCTGLRLRAVPLLLPPQQCITWVCVPANRPA